MVETAIFAQWQHTQNFTLYYARWQSGEVDIVSLNRKQKPQWCIEIKWSDRYVEKVNELRSAHSFCKKHSIRDMIVTTINKEELVNKDEISYYFQPASLYCFQVGYNIIYGRKKRQYI